MKTLVALLFIGAGLFAAGCHCKEGGERYSNGETWTCADGCNICTCNEGEVSTTAMYCGK